MKLPAAGSLKSRLVRRLVPLQAALLTVLVLLLVGSLWGGGCLLHQRDEERVIEVLQHAVARDAGGGLVLRSTPDLQQLRLDNPHLWFSIRDREGHSLAEGEVPPEFAEIGKALDEIGQAKLGWDRSQDEPQRLAARMKRVDTHAGNIQIVATTDGKMSQVKSAIQAGLVFLGLTLPSLILMTLVTLVATPMVVRSAFVGLDEAAHQAGEIDIDKRGARLPVGAVPVEIAPLVDAVNDALGRLDDGYERHKRFLADAAHELRTPIAILITRLEALPRGMEQRRLIEDASRLATLTEQLLDLQRLDHHLGQLTSLDLVMLCAQVTADLAPMAIAAGYEISLQSDAERIDVWGEQSSLERALINLVQNAIQHGGRRGAILVALKLPATIEVTDQGPGIPTCQREQVFEPFHRLQPLTRGAGLGLNLVREIVRLHGGEVSVVDGPCGGACFRIKLPPVSVPYLAAG